MFRISLHSMLLAALTAAAHAADDRPRSPSDPPHDRRTIDIPVKVLVDDEEPAADPVWHDRVKRRLERASQILEKHCGVRFQIVQTATWQSDDTIANFHSLLRDFEQKVQPGPGRLAIGFSSQMTGAADCPELGVTRGLLHSHILVREWFGRTEPERLEVLVHELGHFLGAAHSREPSSVMRSKLGDGQAVARKFRIQFDPLNTQILTLVADELRGRNPEHWQEVGTATRRRLHTVYAQVAAAFPNDPIAPAYLQRFQDPARPDGPASPVTPRTEAIRQVVAAVVRAAERNRSADKSAARPPFSGDALTELYFREAAECAAKLPQEHAIPAYLIGLAIALDTGDLLRANDWSKSLWRSVESDVDRDRRLGVLGLPTMHSRHDLLQHFVASSALTVLAGPQVAEAAGLIKEMKDASAGSGFSFADLAADLAGIAFANHLHSHRNQLMNLSNSFRVPSYMPDIAAAREGLSSQTLQAEFGSPSDPRFLAERTAIVEEIRALPGFQTAATKQ